MIQASKPMMVSYLCSACQGKIDALPLKDVERFKQCPFCGAVIVRSTFMTVETGMKTEFEAIPPLKALERAMGEITPKCLWREIEDGIFNTQCGRMDRPYARHLPEICPFCHKVTTLTVEEDLNGKQDNP